MRLRAFLDILVIKTLEKQGFVVFEDRERGRDRGTGVIKKVSSKNHYSEVEDKTRRGIFLLSFSHFDVEARPERSFFSQMWNFHESVCDSLHVSNKMALDVSDLFTARGH